MRALPHLSLLSFAIACSGCAREVLIEKPVPVEVVRFEPVPVPADLTAERAKVAIPDALTYGDALALWADDRASLDVLNGRLRAIRSLEE